jgi:dipeptidyl-peptidase-3
VAIRAQLAPQPARSLAEVAGFPVLALDVPAFARLQRDQRLLAFQVAQAATRGLSATYELGGRHNLEVVRVLRGILSRPNASSAAALEPIRKYARAVWLFHGLYDPRTGHKLLPSFTPAELRAAALSARAAGADLGLHSLEFGLRALEAAIFDPSVEARRTARGSDLPESANGLYQGVTLRDLASFHEQAPLDSRLVKDGPVLQERLVLLPAAADALDAGLRSSAPPQRALLEPLAAWLRFGQPERLSEAYRAYFEVAGAVDFFTGFYDLSVDPRGRKALFAGFVGVRDEERTAQLARVAEAAPALARLSPVPLALTRAPVAEALFLAAGTSVPEAVTLPATVQERARLGAKSVFFAAASDTADEAREKLVAAIADPSIEADLARCFAEQHFAFVALRELVGRSRPVPREALLDQAALEEARADLVASLLGPLPKVRELGLLPDARCQELWGPFVAAQLVTSLLGLAPGEPLDGDRDRARALQLFWLTAKGALARYSGGTSFAVVDPPKLRTAEADLLGLLQRIESHGDSARLSDLFERHASRAPSVKELEVRLREASVPARVRLIPPRIEGVFDRGKLVDARAVAIDDLDAAVLRDWAGM